GLPSAFDDVRDKVATRKEAKEKLQQEISRSQQSTGSIALHPTAINAYLKSVEQLEESIRTNSLEGSEQSKTALRELVDAAIVYPPQESDKGMRIEVRGYLSRLVGGGLFPQRSYRGGKVVAEERIRRNHPF